MPVQSVAPAPPIDEPPPPAPPSDASTLPSAAATARRLWLSLLHHERWRVYFLVLLTLMLTVTSGIGLLLLVPLLGLAGIDVGHGAVQEISQAASAWLATWDLTPTLPVVILAYVAIVAATALLQRTHVVQTALLEQGFVVAQRQRKFAAIVYADWSFLVPRKSADFLHGLTQEIDRVGGATTSMLSLVARGLLALLYVSVAVYVSPGTSLLVMLSGVGLAAALAHKTRAGRTKGDRISRAFEAYYALISDHLAGLRVIKSHGVEATAQERFRNRSSDTAAAIIDVVRNQADVALGLQVGSAAIMGAIFYTALAFMGLELASILLLLYLFARLVPMITGLQRQFHQLLTLLPAYDRMVAGLKACEARAEPRDEIVDMARFAHELRFERVSFAHEASTPVVVDLDLVIPAGKTTAIVGPSGAGKSTVADLAAGLIHPTAGRIWLDGKPLEGSFARSWRHRIGYVHQDTFLFHESVRENLRAVRPDASEDELLAALRDASASFVLELPQGLDTIAGDRGVRLSGGERQRISLARAILRQPALLVMDEATSALDGENERLILDAIERMGRSRSILIVTHRLNTVRGANLIHVMEQGRIVESGTWHSLWRQQSRFHALCRAQGIEAPPSSEVDTAHV
jgi:ATP-binding cassette, subfamily C, bacterial